MDINYSPDQINSMVDNAISTFMKRKAMADIGESVFEHVLPNKQKDLDVRRAELDIMLRKKQLGLPLDSSDYEDATNNDRSFVTQGTNLAGLRFLQRIPGPTSQIPSVLPHFKIATSVEDTLPSIAKSIDSGGKGYARIFRSAGKYFK